LDLSVFFLINLLHDALIYTLWRCETAGKNKKSQQPTTLDSFCWNDKGRDRQRLDRGGPATSGAYRTATTPLRVDRAIAETEEEEVAQKLKEQIKECGSQDARPAIATVSSGAYC
jgi:hypothetical protein